MTEKNIIPVLNNKPENNEKENVECNTCGKGGCCGGFGIKAGSEKEVVYRNIFLYLAMGIIIFATAYLIMKLMIWLT